jgi:hypothetical protein
MLFASLYLQVLLMITVNVVRVSQGRKLRVLDPTYSAGDGDVAFVEYPTLDSDSLRVDPSGRIVMRANELPKA